jgi:hypothetical protein
MEAAIRALTIARLKARLSACETESSALAREVLSPSTSAERRSEVLMLRAAMQSWSVALWRDLQQLEIEESHSFQERRIHITKAVPTF